MGLWREVVSNTVSFYHEGGGRGFGSHLIFYPELGIGIVTLTNMEYHGLTGYLGRRAMNGPIIEAYGDLPDVEARLDRMRRVDRADPRVQSVLGRYGDSQGATLGYENDVLGIRIDAERFFPMSFLDDAGELVAVYGNNTEARFLPPLGKKPGSMMTVNRRWDNHNSHYLEYNDSPHDPRGPNKSGWQQYVGEYDVIWEDNPSSTVAIEIRNGYVLRTVPFTYANQEIRRRSG
jgi:hypothetical protein